MSEEAQPPKADSFIKSNKEFSGLSTSALSKAEKNYKSKFQALAIEGEVEYAHLKGIQDHYKHKGRWSNFLMFTIAMMIIFQGALLGLVGGGVWDFSAYNWLLTGLLVQNLAQVVGLSVWAVQYLFSDISGQK